MEPLMECQQAHPTALKRQLLSDGITLRNTTLPSSMVMMSNFYNFLHNNSKVRNSMMGDDDDDVNLHHGLLFFIQHLHVL